MKLFIPGRRFVQILLATSAATGLVAQDHITWYKGGEEIVTLSTVAQEVDYSLPLQGKSRYPGIMLSVERGKKKLGNPIMPVVSGRFDAAYLFHEGPGNYTITIFAAPENNPGSYVGVAQFSVNVRGNVPAELPGEPIDRRILSYVNSVKGTQVGRGECWDLAQEALDKLGADWARPLNYGKQVNPTDAKPGDIVQFKQVKIVEKLPHGQSRWEMFGMPDHTAVVYEVLGPLKFRLAHQNIGGNRTVQITEVNLAKKTQGKFTIHRPRAGLLFGN